MSTPTETAPPDFQCDTCSLAHQIPTLSVTRTPGNTLVHDMEAMAEVEHFAATGCRGRLSIQCDHAATLATLQAENAELRARVDNATTLHAWETKNLRAEAEARATAAEGELAEVRKERDDYRAKAWTRFELVQAAEGERDRLRGALQEIAGVLKPGFCRLESLAGHRCGESPVCSPCIARKALAATPHTEGEASAPPKETE